MIGDFDYKGYKIIISGYLGSQLNHKQTDQEQIQARFNQKITIIGLDKQVDLFLENSTYSEAKSEVIALIDKNSL